MNLREGTRRLALLLGVVGAIVCGVLSYAQLQSTMHQRADHIRFEQLANSPAIHGAVVAAKDGLAPNRDNGRVASFDMPPGTSGGIRTVNFWDPGFKIQSLEMEDGETLYPTPAPGVWSYFLIAILPVFGFFVPWGAARAIGWVGAGFVQPLK